MNSWTIQKLMSLMCKVQVTINNISDKKAETLRKALEPDNINFPENLTLELVNFDNKLVFNFQSYGDMKKLISTVDEVLEHLQVAIKVIE